MLVIGAGRIGSAVYKNLGAELVPARDFVKQSDLYLDSYDTILHAAGQAGEAACAKNPAAAFAMHYKLTERLTEWCWRSPRQRRLILLGTVAPNVGFYGPLKRAAIAHALSRSAPGDVLVIECGLVIGPDMGGVVGSFVTALREGHSLFIQGNGSQTIRYTPLQDLIALLARVHQRWPVSQTLSLVSEPVRVIDLARQCLEMACVLANRPIDSVIRYANVAEALHSYEEPTGFLEPVQEIFDVLRDLIAHKNIRTPA